jgi:tetraacyldisaccharide-1-P 4'-kinase
MRIIAFSGIGDHGSFLESLVRIGIKPVGERRFPDHHRYGKIDIDSLETERQRVEADCFLTTEKDMTRLTAGGGELLKFFGRTPVLYTTVGIRFIEGAGILDGAVDACSRRGRG